jgi:hypothetical protein
LRIEAPNITFENKAGNNKDGYFPKAYFKGVLFVMDAASYLYLTRKIYREAHKKFSLEQFIYDHLIPPWWMIQQQDRRFCTLFRDQNILLQKGIIVWGHLIQANNLLFEPGKWEHPAVIVCSPKPLYEENLGELARIARELYELKDKNLDHPEMLELKSFGEIITNEMDCPFNVPIPSCLTMNQLVYFTSILVYRKHLPLGYLSSGWFPVLIAPDKTPAAMILPSRYWAPELVETWCDE